MQTTALQSLRPMKQLTGHVSYATAFENRFFPYCFGQFTTVRVWIQANAKGERLVYCSYNPHNDDWAKPKDSATYDLVFLFQNSTGFISEQTLNLRSMTLDNVLYVAEHYHTNTDQKARIIKYLANPSYGAILHANNRSVVWLNDELSNGMVVPFALPESELLKPVPNPEPSLLIGVEKAKKPVGRPVKAQPILDEERPIGLVKDAATLHKEHAFPNMVTRASKLLNRYTLVDGAMGDALVLYSAQNGQPATLEYVKTLRERRVREIQIAHETAIRELNAFNDIPVAERPVVNLSAPHSAENNHYMSETWLHAEFNDAENLVLAAPSLLAVFDQHAEVLNG